MSSDSFYCPLLAKNIAETHCLSITYAAEGRISQTKVPEIENWERAQDICADCVNAYWNKNDMPHPGFAHDHHKHDQ